MSFALRTRMRSMSRTRMHSMSHMQMRAACTLTRSARRTSKEERCECLVGLRVVVGVALFLFRIGHRRAGQFVVAIVVARVFRILF